MAPSLAHFPDLCLETIFKHVPQSDLLYSVGLVCKSWYKTRRTELNKRRRLVLFQSEENEQENLNNYRMNLCSFGTDLIERVRRDDGSSWLTLESLEQFKFDALRAPCGIHTGRNTRQSTRLALQAKQFFSSLRNFSTITCLSVHACTNSILTNVMQLIDHFSEHLVELNLKLNFLPNRIIDIATQQVHDDSVANLFVCLNKLQSIEHLKLDLNYGIMRVLPQPLSCLAHLTTFGFTSNGDQLDNVIIASLNQYARNVTSIELDGMDLQGISQLHNQLVAKFTSLSVLDVNVFRPIDQRYNEMSQFCTRFSSLTKLQLPYLMPMPMTMLARCLSLLPQLVHLYLGLLTNPPAEVGAQAIAQVPSVRLLSLSFVTHSHHEFELLHIPQIFPNVQVLRLKNILLVCQDCLIGFRRGGGPHRIEGSESLLAHRIAECHRLARQPFRACANLHTIELVEPSNVKTLINVNEL